jgi:lysophospholipase L1-like esterase
MKTILCYGDSNTWGFIPGSINFETMYMERYPRNKRWTGLLQNKLGNDYYVIEEGLNGRTTNVDYESLEGRNGKTFLPTLLYTHSPLDLIVIMLGINDLKKEFNRNCEDISQGMSEIIKIIKNSKYDRDMQSPPQVLLVSSAIPSNENYCEDMFANAIVLARQLARAFKDVAEKYNGYYFDAAP